MPKDYKPPQDATHVFAKYKAHYEGERELKPQMLEIADRELKAGATVGQLAKLTGLTPEVFRRRARTLGVEHKRPPTVGKLGTAPEQKPDAPSQVRRPAAATRPRKPSTSTVFQEGRPLTDAEAASLAALARSRASELQAKRLEQDAASVGDAYKDFTIVSSAMAMSLLSHDEVYGPQPESGEETGAGPVRPDEELT